jgi:hypothetical protein
MARVAPRVPELSEILCSSCGYVLDGLDRQSRCPECGQPISDSLGSDRVPPEWESPEHRPGAFMRTSLALILRPAHFYRTFTVRGSVPSARAFARIHWWIASLLFALTAATHTIWFSYRVWPLIPDFPGGRWGLFAAQLVGLTLLGYLALDGITRLAAILTNWEATYRGLRLPYSIVLRGMYYHAAHYLPVAVVALAYVAGYQLLLRLYEQALPRDNDMDYLYGLCALVVLSAVYLFVTYWTGMRNMMYANR